MKIINSVISQTGQEGQIDPFASHNMSRSVHYYHGAALIWTCVLGRVMLSQSQAAA